MHYGYDIAWLVTIACTLLFMLHYVLYIQAELQK